MLFSDQNLKEIDLTTSTFGWISCNVVFAICKLQHLKNVCFDSSRIRLFYGPEEHHCRKLYPCYCWGSKRINKEGFILKHHYTQKNIDHYKRHEKNTVENITLNRLRDLTFKGNFTDLAWMSEAKEFMDPLLYHEFKCRPGVFYNSDEDSDMDSDISETDCPDVFLNSSDTSDTDEF